MIPTYVPVTSILPNASMRTALGLRHHIRFTISASRTRLPHDTQTLSSCTSLAHCCAMAVCATARFPEQVCAHTTITIISRRRPPCILHHTSALQWMRGDGWDSLIHYQHRRHCHPVAKAVPRRRSTRSMLPRGRLRGRPSSRWGPTRRSRRCGGEGYNRPEGRSYGAVARGGHLHADAEVS